MDHAQLAKMGDEHRAACLTIAANWAALADEVERQAHWEAAKTVAQVA